MGFDYTAIVAVVFSRFHFYKSLRFHNRLDKHVRIAWKKTEAQYKSYGDLSPNGDLPMRTRCGDFFEVRSPSGVTIATVAATKYKRQQHFVIADDCETADMIKSELEWATVFQHKDHEISNEE